MNSDEFRTGRDWADIYQRDTKLVDEGIERENIARAQLLEFNLHLKKFGFMAGQKGFSSIGPPEPGIPDYVIVEFLDHPMEITGTRHLDPAELLWFRASKCAWADRHPEFKTWGAHVISNLRLVRYVRLERTERYPLRYHFTGKGWEPFRDVPPNDSIGIAEFIAYLVDQVGKR